MFGATDTGQVREHNEDNLLVADLSAGTRGGDGTRLSGESGARGALIAVADGMGGAASGEIASATAVQTVHDMFAAREIREDTQEEEILRSLEASLRKANEEIYQRGQRESEHRGMGTTMTAVFALRDRLYIAQVGDSRAYLLRKGKLVQVTKDQSLISQLIEDGTLTEEEAEKLGGRNIILQALGVEADVKIASKSVEVLDGDTLVLCSDGLSGMVKDPEIQATLDREADLEKAARTLIRMANEAGGRDNITVILARFEGEGLRPPLQAMEGEAAGGEGAVAAFVAPEVPKERKRLWPLFAAAGVLVVATVILLLVLGGSGQVTFAFPAKGGKATLTPRDGKGSPIRVDGSGGDRVSVEVDPGDYFMDADLAHHEPLRRLLVKISRGDSTVDVPLRPLPGSLVLRGGAPGTRVRFVAGGVQNLVSVQSTEEIEVAVVPAGTVTFRLDRDGFETASFTRVLPPAERLVVDLPALREILGRILVKCGVPGARVKVLVGLGEEITAVADAAGDAEFDVRVGSHQLVVTAEKHLPSPIQTILVEQGATRTIAAALVPVGGRLSVTAPPDTMLILVQGGVQRNRRNANAEGKAVFENVPPGKYVVQATIGDRLVDQEVEVRPAEDAEVRFTE